MNLFPHLLVSFLAITACSPKEEPAARVIHSTPAAGVRMVEIKANGSGRTLKLRSTIGSDRISTWGKVDDTQIVVVENLGGKCGVYIRQDGKTNKQQFDVPESKPGEPVGLSVNKSVPSIEDISAGEGDILKLVWERISEAANETTIPQSLTFSLVFE